MADEKKQPAKVNRKDYVYCIECEGYILRKNLVERSSSFFSDDPGGLECPAGHLVVDAKPDVEPANG